jgi:hypothetical protein
MSVANLLKDQDSVPTYEQLRELVAYLKQLKSLQCWEVPTLWRKARAWKDGNGAAGSFPARPEPLDDHRAKLDELETWLLAHDPKPAPAVLASGGQSTVLAKPRKLLDGWRDITAALEMKYSDRDKIKGLNDRCKGPIKASGKGTKPLVYADELIDWWNQMANKQQELVNAHEGRKLSATAQYNYGREGTAAPEITGSVKKRRRDRSKAKQPKPAKT